MYTHEYRWEHGNYAFYAGVSESRLQFRTNNVAVLYDRDGGTLLKHGEPDKVREWLKKYEADMAKSRLFWNLVVVEFPPDYPAAEITAMINTSGSVPYHVERAASGNYTPQKSE